MRFELVQGEWFRLLAGSLASAGVTDVVVSPGSRSTPLVVAVHREPRLSVVALPDERSAAFFALGRSRVTSRPTALIRTSGTASAHDYPAVIEASEDHVPLLILSADRPFELQASGAPQTTDQRRLFGRFVRFDLDLGLADAAGFEGLTRAAAKAVFRAKHPVPGPVHLNLRARKPLEPVAPESDAERALVASVDAHLASPRRRRAPTPVFSSHVLDEAAEQVRGVGAGAVVAGPMSPSMVSRGAVERFVAATGFELWPETASQLRMAPVAGRRDDFDWRSEPPPELAVLLGRYPSSRALQALLREVPRLLVVHPFDPADPDGRAAFTYEGPMDAWLEGVAMRLGPGPEPQPSPSPVSAPDSARPPAWPIIERELEAIPFCEAHAVRTVARGLPRGAGLVLGNSLPLRLFDRFVPADALDGSIEVYAQRGVNGIDGAISGAAGVAAARRGPTVAVLGDVTFLHDLGGLLAARAVSAPLVIVVLDNGGGRIFEELPIARTARDDGLLDLFITPHRFDLSAAGAPFGIPAVRPDDDVELERALSEGLARPGPTLIHVRVPPTGASAAEARIREALS